MAQCQNIFPTSVVLYFHSRERSVCVNERIICVLLSVNQRNRMGQHINYRKIFGGIFFNHKSFSRLSYEFVFVSIQQGSVKFIPAWRIFIRAALSSCNMRILFIAPILIGNHQQPLWNPSQLSKR